MNLILGGGTTGLVLLELLKAQNYYLMAPDTKATLGGNAVSGQFKLGPRILHETPMVTKFLQSVGIEAKPNLYRVKYISQDKEVEYPNEKEMCSYYRKTRGGKRNSTCLNNGLKQFYGYDMEELQLAQILEERNRDRIINESIEVIDIFDKKVNAKAYDKLISTLDFLNYITLSSIGRPNAVKLYKKDVVFTLVSRYAVSNPMFEFGNAAFIYFLNHRIFHRATKIDDATMVIESSAGLGNEYLLQYGLKKIAMVTIKSQIIKELRIESFGGTVFAGRYAQYDHSVKLDSIIQRFSEVATW